MAAYPQIFRLRQNFERPRVEDVPAEVEKQLTSIELAENVRPGQSVAIAVGSRGISKIHEIVRGVVQHFLRIGAAPFIVPAMGSHGGGTANGQRRILESYGVTEGFCGCPIRASMDTVVVDRMAENFPIHFDRLASEADHVFVCARVKSHTSFVGRIESGLMKMLLVGLGKHEGAKVFHRAIHDYSFEEIVRSVGRRVLERCHIVGGMAIVENAYNEVARLSAVAPDEFEEADESLLTLAKQWLPRLPFDFAHILLIDEIGKDISGAGMDTNVVGRKFRDGGQAFNETPKIRRIIVRGLSKATHGIAHGVGIADFCKTRVVHETDLKGTWINGLASGSVAISAFPLHFETDRELLDKSLAIIGLVEPQDAKLMWIKNTLDLAEVECSAAYLEEARGRADLEVLTGLRDLPLDGDGNLPDWEQWTLPNLTATVPRS
jgi:hypothetical protein